ncbi:MAG: hypothetical protein EBY80_01665 [Actinobacteria bacterium]|nr:hypothetical protein [Actinomycetota bacterium]
MNVPRRSAILLAFVATVAITASCSSGDSSSTDSANVTSNLPASVPDTTTTSTTTSTTSTTTTTTTLPLVDPRSVGQPWGSTVNGVLTFKGNPTRTFNGTGPVPSAPRVLWSYPNQRMCGESSEYGEVRTWCGTGWVGQPAIFERDGRTWVVFGAYDYKIHFVDAMTGEDIIPPFPTGDIAKGTVTVDPDGYPLIYHGSRDNMLRVIAFDGNEPRELWSFDGRIEGRRWNNDWDAAPLILNDTLIEGGENSWFFGFKLNRGYATDGSVIVNPVETFRVPGFDDQLLRDLGDDRVSLESAVAVYGDTAYLNSSGGLLQGWDISSVRTGVGEVNRVFRYWTGDDSDATTVIDEEGYLYVGVEVDRNNARAREVGQFLKVDPRITADGADPVVWRVDVNSGVDSGTWSTPAFHDNIVIWPTKPGKVYGVDRATGAIVWTLKVGGPNLSSPLVVDDTLILGDATGTLRAWSLTGAEPVQLWEVKLSGNIESTPVMWNGRIYVGSRGGMFVAIGDE